MFPWLMNGLSLKIKSRQSHWEECAEVSHRRVPGMSKLTRTLVIQHYQYFPFSKNEKQSSHSWSFPHHTFLLFPRYVCFYLQPSCHHFSLDNFVILFARKKEMEVFIFEAFTDVFFLPQYCIVTGGKNSEWGKKMTLF